MHRLVRVGQKWYALKMETEKIENDVDSIYHFIKGGDPVLLCDTLELAAEVLAIEVDDIFIVV